MVLKTRDKLIEVARRLFVHKGVEKTTMNDIAEASEKGRRTVYTYFKNKNEIYNAIVEKESDALLAKLKEVVDLKLSPVEKLERYLRVRFELLANLTPSNDYLSTLISSEARKWRKVRKKFIEKEQRLFQTVIDEGVAAGIFDNRQASRLPAIQSALVQAISNASSSNGFEMLDCTLSEMKERIIEFIIYGVVMKNEISSAATV